MWIGCEIQALSWQSPPRLAVGRTAAPDLEGSVFLSPTVNVAGDAITVPEREASFRIVETESRGDFAHAKQTTDRLM